VKALEPVRKLEGRYEAAVAEIGVLKERLKGAEEKWRDTVLVDDPKTEAAALKALSQAQDALAGAKLRLPILAEVVAKAKIDCLPAHAAEIAELQKTINEQAVSLAYKLLEAYEIARAAAKEINRLHAEHTDLLKTHFALCRSAVGDDHHSPIAGIPHDGKFPIIMAQLNAAFRPDFDERFRISEGNLFRREKPIAEVAGLEPAAMMENEGDADVNADDGQ
jgi:hypothetical protein